MRLIYGILIGAIVTVGAAYIHDSKINGPLAEQRRLVNWDVAAGLARSAYDGARGRLHDWTGI